MRRQWSTSTSPDEKLTLAVSPTFGGGVEELNVSSETVALPTVLSPE
jgi:hypothetical protein